MKPETQEGDATRIRTHLQETDEAFECLPGIDTGMLHSTRQGLKEMGYEPEYMKSIPDFENNEMSQGTTKDN
ncbi:unnamed protein product [Caretta caretta]